MDQLTKDYLETFGSIHGQRVLKNLKKLAHYDGFFWPRSERDGHTDIYDVCREAGKRAVIAHIEMKLKSGETNV
jgi:hypothetical protein